MNQMNRSLLSGDEAVALAALHGGVVLGTGYPGTPSTEILEYFSEIGGRAQWAPNEKVALEVGIGVAFAGAAALVTMKHVGLNVAADPLFTVAYTGVDGPLVIVSADDPGLASSQNEQDNRRYAVAAGVPMLEPVDSQQAYDFTLAAMDISRRWRVPVLLRLTTRVCHSKTIVTCSASPADAGLRRQESRFRRDVKGRVMIPAYARIAHRQLRAKLAEIAEWNETSELNREFFGPDGGQEADAVADARACGPAAKQENGSNAGSTLLGIIASGISVMHAREAAPDAHVLQLGMTYPLPIGLIRRFAEAVDRCVVIEEGDPYLLDSIRAAGIAVEGRPEVFRFGELNVNRVRRIIAASRPVPGPGAPVEDEPVAPAGKPPQLCAGCPHRTVFETLARLGCIVSGDIGCYTLGVLPPFNAMDTCVCMGASITVGLGLRHALAESDARRVVSVIGDSTFVHSGLSGLVEMVYNPPATGHVVLILDNGTTAMTGLQEHPGTGRTLDHQPTHRLDFEAVARAIGVQRVSLCDPFADPAGFEQRLKDDLASGQLSLLIARRPCVLAAGSIREYERAAGTAKS